ncbi:hypothetical protein SOJ85_000323 [Cronobacter turicensis]|nr:hypothetical protein [Cronobacter turicensis]
MTKTNLENYLDFYINLESPGYAVLITGEWGSGKTHQVLKAIPLDLQCHVSLFGISNPEEVYGSVFAKMYPGKSFAKKFLEMTKDISGEVSNITFGAGALVGGLISPLIKQTVDKGKVIIFDDLERCSIPNTDILGVINQYVEHHQCRVIIIAHDEKTHSDFISSKEKIIGHTIKVRPQIDDAAAHFFPLHYNINNFTYIKPVINAAFLKTDCKSLRILKNLISDCNRLLQCLEPSHIKNLEAMRELFNSFCIINIEYRLGNITSEDILKLPLTLVDYMTYERHTANLPPEEKEKNRKLTTFLSRFYIRELREGILGNDLLEKILSDGNYPKEEVRTAINKSKFFFMDNKHPAWLTIYNFDSFESDIVRSAIAELFDDFRNLRITDIKDIIHSFCISYMLSDINEIDESFDELYDAQIKYINNLLKNDLLPPEPLPYDPFSDTVYTRPGGSAYWIWESYRNHINSVIEHIKKSRKESQKNKHSLYIKEILSALENDPDHFKLLMLGDHSQAGLYSQIDILKNIPPQEFLIHWLMLPIQLQDKVTSILTERYRNARHNILINEKQWLIDLFIEVIIEARNYKGIDKSRIERLISWKILEDF